MKKCLYLLFVIILLGSCHKIAGSADINFELAYEQIIDIPLNGLQPGTPLPPGGADFAFPTYAVATNSAQKLDDYNAKKEKVKEITVLQFGWLYLNPGHNFDCFDSVQFFISAPGQPERLVAYNYNIAKGLATLNFELNKEVNLKNYLLADTVYYRMHAHVNAVPPQNTPLRVLSTYHLIANPLF
jgi:hypothetical protein